MDTKKIQREKEVLPQEPYRFTKRLGSTTYHVAVHFSRTSKETADEKLIRIIRNDVALRKAANL